MKKSLILGIVFCLSIVSMRVHAGQVDLQSIPPSMTEKGETLSLESVGKGIRWKNVGNSWFSLKVQVYQGELFVSDKKSWDPRNPIESLTQMRGSVLHFSFLNKLKSISGKMMRESFETALLSNHVNLSEDGIPQLLDLVEADEPATKGKDIMISLFISKDAQSGTLTYRGVNSTSTEIEFKDPHVLAKLALIWFGESSDEELMSFKKDLLGV